MNQDLSKEFTRDIIKKLLNGENYRFEIIKIINSQFLNYCINFFQKVISAKLQKQSITLDWYKETFLDQSLPSEDIAIHSGLNKKTVSNMRNSATKEVVIEESLKHYDILCGTIEDLIKNAQDLDITLTIKFEGVSVDLNISESLLVINALAVKRSALRGGSWSALGKRVEEPLMKALCKLYRVPKENYRSQSRSNDEREIDFWLINNKAHYKCEVKLMGKGNPESADAGLARGSHVFIADKLSEKFKKEFDRLCVFWVELNSEERFLQFENILKSLKIPYEKPSLVSSAVLENILKNLI